MISIYYKDSAYGTSVFHLAKAFFPHGKVKQQVDIEQEPLLRIAINGGTCFSIYKDDLSNAGININSHEKVKRFIIKKAYGFFHYRTKKSLPWGILTGVRPTKLATAALEHLKKDLAVNMLCNEYFVAREKAELAVDVACRERNIISNLDLATGFSLYINIPFCPSICTYCSFGSANINKWLDKTDAYVSALCKEIEILGEFTVGNHLNTIYIGGGTPTSLEVYQLERILDTIDKSFSKNKLVEYTMEAGRPDTITREKLILLREYPITRISINPQTMHQRTLDKIGRGHKSASILSAYEMARSEGFDNINMDIIIGLPGEGVKEVKQTLIEIEKMNPDSLTIHSLAIKRASKYGEEHNLYEFQANRNPKKEVDNMEIDKHNYYDKSIKLDYHNEIEEIFNLCSDFTKRMDMTPYYLYRQKNITGNFENVGFAKVDKAGIYNILIMEEVQTIFGAGSSAVTKIVAPKDTYIDDETAKIRRFNNPKDIKLYIEKKSNNNRFKS